GQRRGKSKASKSSIALDGLPHRFLYRLRARVNRAADAPHRLSWSVSERRYGHLHASQVGNLAAHARVCRELHKKCSLLQRVVGCDDWCRGEEPLRVLAASRSKIVPACAQASESR